MKLRVWFTNTIKKAYNTDSAAPIKAFYVHRHIERTRPYGYEKYWVLLLTHKCRFCLHYWLRFLLLGTTASCLNEVPILDLVFRLDSIGSRKKATTSSNSFCSTNHLLINSCLHGHTGTHGSTLAISDGVLRLPFARSDRERETDKGETGLLNVPRKTTEPGRSTPHSFSVFIAPKPPISSFSRPSLPLRLGSLLPLPWLIGLLQFLHCCCDSIHV